MIPAGTPVNPIGTIATVDKIIPGIAIQPIVAAQTFQNIGNGIPADRLGKVVTRQVYH